MSWKKLSNVCRISWNSPAESDAYVYKKQYVQEHFFLVGETVFLNFTKPTFNIHNVVNIIQFLAFNYTIYQICFHWLLKCALPLQLTNLNKHPVDHLHLLANSRSIFYIFMYYIHVVKGYEKHIFGLQA